MYQIRFKSEKALFGPDNYHGVFPSGLTAKSGRIHSDRMASRKPCLYTKDLRLRCFKVPDNEVS